VAAVSNKGVIWALETTTDFGGDDKLMFIGLAYLANEIGKVALTSPQILADFIVTDKLSEVADAIGHLEASGLIEVTRQFDEADEVVGYQIEMLSWAGDLQ
jgi:hypothetical protein